MINLVLLKLEQTVSDYCRQKINLNSIYYYIFYFGRNYSNCLLIYVISSKKIFNSYKHEEHKKDETTLLLAFNLISLHIYHFSLISTIQNLFPLLRTLIYFPNTWLSDKKIKTLN